MGRLMKQGPGHRPGDVGSAGAADARPPLPPAQRLPFIAGVSAVVKAGGDRGAENARDQTSLVQDVAPLLPCGLTAEMVDSR
jgi:hypothetical protein